MNLKLGIVGWPLTKTYSPLIHKVLGEFLGINVEYQKVPIENLDRQKIQDVNSKFDGYNITVPHKNKIIELIENTDGYLPDHHVKELGICNTIKLVDNNIYAFNTDIEGINKTLESIYTKINNKNFLILGSGGSSKTIEYLFKEHNTVQIASREPNLDSISYNEINDIAPKIDILINTTPIGMPPFEEESLNIPFDQFNNLEVFFNLGYNVKENFTSKFSEDVIQIDGIKMLITQAVASFNIWADSEIKLEDVYHNITERLKNEN